MKPTAAADAALHTVAPPTVAPRRSRWDIKPDSGTATAALPTAALPTAALPAAAPHTSAPHAGASHTAIPPAGAPMLLSGELHRQSGAKVGGGGRPQQACGNTGVGCNNHKVLDCSYGLCGLCCVTVIRDPQYNVAKHSRKNKHN